MKYPIKQFNILIGLLKQLAVHIDLTSINPSSLHYIVYQQLSEGQTHNHLYCVDGATLKRYHQLTDVEKSTAQKLIQVENRTEFLLYPDGCNDAHIETAVKKALKQLAL